MHGTDYICRRAFPRVKLLHRRKEKSEVTGDTGSLDRLAGFIERHPGALVLTGAGISTASGIPDYRDANGVRRGRAPVQGPEFRASEAVRRRYWARSMIGWPVIGRAQPNSGHRALARLQAHGRLGAIITQNVDGLHQRAGSSDVLELHGSIHAVVCLACGQRQPRAQVQAQLEASNPHMAGAAALPAPDGDAHLEPVFLDRFQVPECPRCGGVLQPDVVFFGDAVPGVRTGQANDLVDQASALLVVGSSVMVHSGYRLCTRAAESGKPLAALNAGKTRADHLFSIKSGQALQEFLPLLAAMLLPGAPAC
jgi:NAD-dependent SIR2 family protein deacetylase